MLDKAPGVRFVVTTQAPLKLASEMVYRIGPLTVPQGPLPAAQALGFSAVALFVDRARMADARFVLTDANAPAVIELCRQLDGLALAIELAAARAPMLGVQRLAASMGDRLKVLFVSVDPDRDTPAAAGEYAHHFSPRILAATAPHAVLEPFTRQLGVLYAAQPAVDGAYNVDHSAHFVVLDRDVRVIGIIRPPHIAAAIAADLERLVALP